MNTLTKAQILEFSTNWKKFHGEGKHKKKPRKVESYFPVGHYYYFKPFYVQESDLSFVYHLMYTWIRNLPLTRGMDTEQNNILDKITCAPRTQCWYMWRILNVNMDQDKMEEGMKLFKEVFGENMNIDIISEFFKSCEKFRINTVDNT